MSNLVVIGFDDEHKAFETVNPAEWFDISETPTQLIKLGTKAIF